MSDRRSLLGIADLSTDDIARVLGTAGRFGSVMDRDIKKVPTLRGRTVVNLFLESSTRTSTSSAGLSPAEPPQTTQPPSRSTTRRMAGRSSSTGASISMVSAVPAGEVIAREEVLGIMRPCAATTATTMGVVRLPGSPPTQCLSMTMVAGQVMRSPASTMARVSESVSPASRRSPAQAVMKAARCISE